MYQKAFIIFSEKEKNWWKSQFTPYIFLSRWETIESWCPIHVLSIFRLVIYVWISVWQKRWLYAFIYYLMDYDKLRPRLRSSWVHFKLCRCTCSDAPLRNQVLSISSQIATLDLLKQYHVALRHFNWWFVFWVFPFIHIIVEGVTFLGTLLFKQQARKNFSPLSLSKGVHGTWFYRANTEKELWVNHEVNWGINARLAHCWWQQIASICENTQNVSNINVLCRIHHRNA